MSITQNGRLLRLLTPLAEDFLLAKRIRVNEGLSQLFHINVEMLHEENSVGYTPTSVNLQSLIGQPMTIEVNQTDGTQRYFNGICYRFNQGNRNERFSKYSAELVPKVWFLTQVSQSRIFQNISVPDILKQVFNQFEVSYEIQGTFEPRNYCVQYRETDWDFASRLMEEEGIYYHFEHTQNTHRMIVANTPLSHRPCPGKNTLPYITNISSLDETWVGCVLSWMTNQTLKTGKVTLWDHNFELPGRNLEAQQTSRFTLGGSQQMEVYDYPGYYANRFDGIDRGGGLQSVNLQKIFEDRTRTVQIRQQELDAGCRTDMGTSNCCALTGGYRFTLTDHPVAALNIGHILVNVQIEAIQSPDYNSDQEVGNAYQTHFSSIPHGEGHAPYRPPRKTEKPILYGSQTAIVVGPAGEEIFTDKYGRVKVQFHWDREGKADSSSSCWIRVAQSWAGKNWGTMFIPRIGMEVVVDFMEGDPDQPIIVGCVYNAETMPPYTLPDEKTKSTIKSNSSKGGGGFNEIRLEDKKGSEQIFIHAEKDKDIRVKNDCKEIILRDRHLIIERNQYEMVKKDKHLQVRGDHNEKITGSMSLTVNSDLQEKVSSNYALESGMGVHIKAGMSAVIEAGATLTLKVGGNFININPAGIFVQGTMVMINSGGAAGAGAGCNPDAPKDPLEADKAEPGQTLRPKQVMPPLQPVTFGPMAQLMQNAAKNAVPFCEICAN